MNDKNRGALLHFAEFAARDAVCGMRLNPQRTTYRALLGAKTYHFCSLRCQQEFDQNPNQYAVPNRGGL